MQDPSTYFNNKFPEHEILKCPRCDSSNTKFCYYNNYNLSQPRHYCKNCKRYWTKGGTLRNIPAGGASRKITERSSSSNPKRSTATITTENVPVTDSSSSLAETVDNNSSKNQHQPQKFVGTSTSASASYLIDSLYPMMGMGMAGFEQMGQRERVDPKMEETSEERFAGMETGDMNSWSGSNCDYDWPDLAIYTPGGSSAFQ